MNVQEEHNEKLSTSEELKMLKERLRELELQNKKLREQQGLSNGDYREKIDHSESNEPISIDDLDLLDLTTVDLSDDDTWLYVLPRKDRDILSDADAVLATSITTSLRSTTQSIAYRSPLASSPTTANAESPPGYNGTSPVTTTNVPGNGSSGNFNCKTFTRPRRSRPRVLGAPYTNGAIAEDGTTPSSVSSPDDVGISEASPMSATASSMSTTPSPKKQPSGIYDVDVLEIARMQEESLRNCSPLPVTRHRFASASRGGALTDESPVPSDSEDISQASSSVPRSYPVVSGSGLRYSSNRHHQHQQHQRPPPGDYDSGSSAGTSPYGSNNSLHNGNNSEAPRRSLPDLQARYGSPSSGLAAPRGYGPARGLKSEVRQKSDSDVLESCENERQQRRSLQPPNMMSTPRYGAQNGRSGLSGARSHSSSRLAPPRMTSQLVSPTGHTPQSFSGQSSSRSAMSSYNANQSAQSARLRQSPTSQSANGGRMTSQTNGQSGLSARVTSPQANGQSPRPTVASGLPRFSRIPPPPGVKATVIRSNTRVIERRSTTTTVTENNSNEKRAPTPPYFAQPASPISKMAAPTSGGADEDWCEGCF